MNIFDRLQAKARLYPQRPISLSLPSPRVQLKGILKSIHTLRIPTLYRSMALRSILLAMAMVLGTTALAWTMAWRQVSYFEQAMTAKRLNQGQQMFTSITEDMARELESLSAWLSAQPSVISYTKGTGGDPLPLFQSSISTQSVDFIAINKVGEISLVAPAGMKPVVTAARPEDIAPSLNNGNQIKAGLIKSPNGEMQWGYETPITERSTLIVGYVLGHAFSDRFKASTGLDLSLYSEDKLVGTSLRGTQGERITDLKLRPDVTASTLQSGIVSMSSDTILDNKYQSQHIPIYDKDGKLAGAYSISAPIMSFWEEQLKVLKDSLPFFLQLEAIAIIAAYLLSKRAFASLKPLRLAVSRMGEGDLKTPIQGNHNYEMMPLVEEMEEMRQNLNSALNQLAIEKSVYGGIFNSMADATFTTDEELRITSFNPAAQMLFEGAETIQLGDMCRGSSVLRDPEGRPLCDTTCIWLWMRDIKEPLLVKGQIKLEGQEEKAVEVTVAPIKDEAEKTVGIVHVLRDISAQEEVRRLKERFLMNVAHELRTPLASLSASIEMMEEDLSALTPEDRSRMLDTVHRGALRLQNLVTNLMDIGSIQTGKFTVKREPIDLATSIQGAVTLSDPLLVTKGQNIKTVVPPDLSQVYADGHRVGQVLMNLITNASKYSPDGDSIIVTAEEWKENVYVSVQDHGPGISKDDQQRIFEYYYRVAGAEKSADGFGLGLGIVKGIIEAHHGQIGMDTEIGKGTTFWFTLPKA